MKTDSHNVARKDTQDRLVFANQYNMWACSELPHFVKDYISTQFAG